MAYPGLGQASLQDLNAQKKALQDSIAHNQAQKKEQQTVLTKLKSEMDKLNKQIDATQNTINDMNHQIEQVTHHIADLSTQIQQQTDQINVQKANLEDAMSHMYIDGAEKNPTLELLQTQTISDAVASMQSYQSIETEIKNKADEIEQLKADLEQKKTDAEKEQNALKALQDQQIQQKRALDAQRSLKQDLSNQTIQTIGQLDSTIQQYQDQLKSVDGAIDRFLAALKSSDGYVAAAGDFVVVNSQSWHYYQTDPRWGGIQLDPSAYGDDSMARYGCLITSITMVANFYGYHLDPGQVLQNLKKGGGMYGDLINWSGVTQAFGGKLDFVTGGKEPFNAQIADATLASGKPLIVRVNPPNSDGFHYIVVSGKVGGKYTVEDPYFQTGRVYPASWIDYMARLQPTAL